MSSPSKPSHQPAQAPADEIIVSGYPERYLRAVRHVLAIEGGWANHKEDRGGATNYGISLRFLVAEGRMDLDGDGFADFDLDMDGDIDGMDVRQLTTGDAIFLYHRCFWKPIDADSFPRPLGEALFDQAVNGGLLAARKLLQRAINHCHARLGRPPIAVDGAIGAKTRAAYQALIELGGVGMPGLLAAFRKVVEDRYLAIIAADPSQAKFKRGWLRRARELGRWAE
mgnify:CR=1 FL=1